MRLLSPSAKELNCIAHTFSRSHLDKSDYAPHLFADAVTLLVAENDPCMVLSGRKKLSVKIHKVTNIEGI